MNDRALMWIEAGKREPGVLLRVQVQPSASRTEVVGLHGEPPRLKIRLAAPPVDGAANEELIRFLAKTLGIKKAEVTLLRGETSRTKDVFCSGLDVAAVSAHLLPGS